MMGKLMREALRFMVGLSPRSLATTNATGRYFPIKGYDKIVFLIACGAIAYADPGTPNQVVAQVRKATSAAGAGAADLTGFTASVVGQVKAKQMNVVVNGVTNDVTIAINGITYTKKAATTAANREFADANGLRDCVNHATKGVPGVLAAANGTNVTLTAINPDDTLISAVGYEAAKLVPSTDDGLAIIEVDEEDVPGFSHVAIKLTTTGTIVCSAQAVMARGRRGETPIYSGQYPA